MTRKRNIRGISAAGLLAVPIMLSGCGPLGGKESKAIDPPPAQVENQMLNTAAGKSLQGQIGLQTTVYLSDQNGKLAPVTLGIPQVEGKDPVVSALEVMIEGGSYSGYIPVGFWGVLPAGTEIKQVTVDKENKLAAVEFNKSFSEYKEQDERKILEALTWTLTGHEDIDKVQLWVEGAKLNEMPVNHTPLDRPLSRTMGINLQKADDTQYSQSSPVTVYFSGLSPSGIQYYVPVTRLVASGQDTVTAALHELIRGPQHGDGLEQVMTSETSVAEIKKNEDGSLTVSLNESMFEQGDEIPSEMLQAVVLTVSENSNNAKVKIHMNDLAEVKGDDGRNYSEPVSRPEHINEIPI
ncbi:GerMN domain-containing protein [Paenibacillus dakarensis]|uniref:GerMN domain-containing protein n=1 Tax=Paenibacillus dakarensis TaxID=1527293 RepID=UPI0006D5A2E7|nr:GerMN domain-containing protein [Paenibacillus dakarensis]